MCVCVSVIPHPIILLLYVNSVTPSHGFEGVDQIIMNDKAASEHNTRQGMTHSESFNI